MIYTRFAPSPTGYLHVGSVRTALFSWLYAKKHSGKFILRIEDSDFARSTKESVDTILSAMSWLGITHDNKVYYQTKRFDRYKEVINKLIQEGKAYYCNCSKERLYQLKEYQQAHNIKTGYDGKCRNEKYIPQNSDSYIVRFKNSSTGTVSWNDAVKLNVSIANKELDDIVIQRSDGSPTYNFCAVVDDIDMSITHVIRGEDHVSNTPKQINIYNALGAKIPIFVHVPIILGSDGIKLSKRNGNINIMQYREDGYLPHAMLNYLVRLGWSNGDQEIFSLENMVANFDLNNISASPSRFDLNKLKWINKYYIKESNFTDIKLEIEYHFIKAGINISNGPNLYNLYLAMSDKVATLKELAIKSKYFYENEIIYDKFAMKKYFKATAHDMLKIMLEKLIALNDNHWHDTRVLHNIVSATAQQYGVSMGKISMPLRIAVTGSDQSPSIGVTLMLIGKSRVLTRLKLAIRNFFIYHQADH